MFVFSGGRGLHIWVNDKRARQLKDSVRKGLVDYLELVTGNVKAESLLAERVVGMVDNNMAWRSKGKELVDKADTKEYYLRNYTSAHV
jgi:DNA primase catalytic subunit